jgi:hypothetical protein
MKAVVEGDIIRHITESGDTEIGAIPADKKGVGLERLRWTGTEIVDLTDLSQIWVRSLGADFFELHAVQLPGTQLVSMTYGQRKELIMNNGLIRVKTAEEVSAETRAAQIHLLKAQLWARQRASIGRMEDQLANAYKLIYLLMYYAKTGNPQISDFIDQILPDIKDTFPLDRVKNELETTVRDMNAFMKDYYTCLDQLQARSDPDK